MSEALAHLAGDYIVQTDWMAQEKTKRTAPAVLHAVTYAACFLPVTRNWRAILTIGLTHFLIDRWRLIGHLMWAKNQLAPKVYRYRRAAGDAGGYSLRTPPELRVWLGIIGDNTAHLAINRWALWRWGR